MTTEVQVKKIGLLNLKSVVEQNEKSLGQPDHFQEEDRKLNEAFKFCVEQNEMNSGDKPGLARAAQRAWIRYRDSIVSFFVLRWKRDPKLVKSRIGQMLTHVRANELRSCEQVSEASK